MKMVVVSCDCLFKDSVEIDAIVGKLVEIGNLHVGLRGPFDIWHRWHGQWLYYPQRLRVDVVAR